MNPLLKVHEVVHSYLDSEEKKRIDLGPFSFQLREGEALGVVGESGSGKTSLARLLCRFLQPSGGSLWFVDKEYSKLSDRDFYRQIQYIDQDPYASFHPRRTVWSSLMEVCENYRSELGKAEKRTLILAVLASVHLDETVVQGRPASLSGGECQRAAIARALLVQPRVLVCDEITSALDMTIQADMMRLLVELKEQYKMTFVFISHDLPLVSQFCDRMLVLKDGKILEQGSSQSVVRSPRDPYTEQLLEYYMLDVAIGGEEDA